MLIERLTDPLRTLFAIPNTPDALGWDDWVQWEKDSARRYPVRWLLGCAIPSQIDRTWRRFVHDPWYWLKCSVWHRYNVVRCRSLPPTWCYRDRLLLHVSFQVLTDFVERERPWELYEIGKLPNGSDCVGEKIAGPDSVFKTVRSRYLELGHDEEDARERAASWGEVAFLYCWWRERLKASEDCRNENTPVYDDDTDMLCRLAKVRKCLWT